MREEKEAQETRREKRVQEGSEEGKLEPQGGARKRRKSGTRRGGAMEEKKNREMRIQCLRRATCRTDT